MESASEDFTIAGYRSLLAETVAGLPVVGFDVLQTDEVVDGRFCLIRHDIDMSPTAAVATARVEAELGVRATYAVLLTGTFYSAFEGSVRDDLMEIHGLGHEIALHFDAAWHGIDTADQLNDALRWESDLLSRLLDGLPIGTFSFHNTTPFTMSCRQASYAGLVNTYAGALRDHVEYVSDSNGLWRYSSWSEVLSCQPDRLQVLTHPEWWTGNGRTPAETVVGHLNERSAQSWDSYVEALKANGRENRAPVPRSLQILSEGSDMERQILYDWLSGRRGQAYAELRRLVDSLPETIQGTSPSEMEELAEQWSILKHQR